MPWKNLYFSIIFGEKIAFLTFSKKNFVESEIASGGSGYLFYCMFMKYGLILIESQSLKKIGMQPKKHCFAEAVYVVLWQFELTPMKEMYSKTFA